MFVTGSFLLIFIITVFLFFLGKGEKRIYLLSMISFTYCMYLDLYASLVLLFVSLFNYIAGHMIYRMKKAKKAFFLGAVGIDIGILCFYKYGLSVFQWFIGKEIENQSVVNLLLIPLGFSFYLFQSISYLADMKNRKYEPENNFLKFILYMSFFPKFISGPIERMDHFKNEIERCKTVKFWNRARLSEALAFILYGYFMKVVMADRLSITVNKIFEGYETYGRFWLLMGVLLYSVQIYTDFAGYSYIAAGCAKVFGINININFRNPYFAFSISEFWRRWHISLSSWLRDYLYIPLGGNRKGKLRKNLNTLLVFTVCGLWHGQGFTYLIWGILHGLYSMADPILHKSKNIFSKGILFIQIAFAWLFFRAASVTEGIHYFLSCMIPNAGKYGIRAGYEKLELTGVEVSLMAGGIIFMILMEYFAEKKGEIVPVSIQHFSIGKRYFVFYILLMMILIFGIYGRGYDASAFVYMQF